MIDIDNFEIFKNNLSTLKETSKNEHDGVVSYMTESTIEVIDFDGVKDEYIKELHSSEKPTSNDVLYIGKDNKLIFIEFKNDQLIGKLKFEIRLKIYESLLIVTDIIGQGVGFTRKNMDYILVYNDTKNPLSEKVKLNVQESKSRVKIGKKFYGEKALKHFIRFDLERFEKLYLKNVYTYTEGEFEEFFLDKL